MRAIGEAAREGHRKCSYVEGILRNWEKDRLFSLSLVEGHLKAWESKKAGDSSRRQYKTAYERTMDTARSEIEKFKKGEVTIYDV